MKSSLLRSLLVIACVSCARDVPPEAPPLCFLSTVDSTEAEEDDDEDPDPSRPLPAVTAAQWRQLIVGRAQGQASADCSGRAIELAASAASCASEPSAALVALELNDDSITEKRIDTHERLVFIRTHSLGDEVIGVVALVHQDHRGLTVKALGHLRSRASRIRLSLEQVGERQMIIADGESCEGNLCTRDARFLVRNDDRLSELPVYLEPRAGEEDAGSRVCLGSPVIAMARQQTETLETGWERTFRLAASWEVSGQGLVIHEQVFAHDSDPREPGVPPAAYREVNADRTWTLGSNEWIASERALLGRTMTRTGAIDVPTED